MNKDSTIVNYKTFTSNEEFVEWQKKEDPAVFSVVPLGFLEPTMTNKGENWEFEAKPQIQVFVTYAEKQKANNPLTPD